VLSGMSVSKLLLWVSVLLLVLVLVAARALMRELRRHRMDLPWPFVQAKPLSTVEQVLFHRLVQALPDHIVLAQVQMSQFLRVRKGRPVREWRNRISQKTVDFLVCKSDFTIVDARIDRELADATKNRALAAAGVPLVRWHVSALPDFDAIRAMIGTVLQDRSGGTEALPRARVAPTLQAGGLQTTHIEASNDPAIVAEEQRP
jgi:Protein of unknown function (DUF2726)